jgi:hypothetical protein
MNNKKTLLILCVPILSIAGCQPSEAVIQTAIAKTQVAALTSTTSLPTAISLENIDLSKIIFSGQDLPLGYAPSKQLLKWSAYNVPAPINFLANPLAITVRREGL